MARQPKGRPAIIGPSKDGYYECWMPTGEYYANGRPKRKKFKRRTTEAVSEAIADWEKLRKQGHGKAVKIETVGQWMAYYTESIVRPTKEYGTWRDVESMNRLYITPQLGGRRLSGIKNRLEVEDLDKLYADMAAGKLSDEPLSDHYVRRCHRILSRALKVAVRRGRADRNVCELRDAPAARKAKPKPLKQQHAIAVLREAISDTMAARWIIGLIAGPRQGEVLGLRWSRVELDPAAGETPHILVEKKLQRRTWEHGCGNPVACVAGRKDSAGKPAVPCRTKPCPPNYAHGCGNEPACGRRTGYLCPARQRAAGCARHLAEKCPPVCPPRCGAHASTCPERTGGGLVEGQTKSERSERPLAIGTVGAELLRQHRERQQQAMGKRWKPTGYVFAQPDGRPLDPRRDYEAWKRLLERAGVPHSKLHAARHTSGTYLKATGTDLRDIQVILGHAQMETTTGYADVALDAQREAMDRVTAALLDGELGKLLVAQKVA